MNRGWSDDNDDDVRPSESKMTPGGEASRGE